MENTVIGTDLEINVGKNYKGKLGVSGKSEQATRSGNNKFDISKATKASGSCSFKNNGDSIDITTTYIGGYISANIDITDLFKEGETIYAKANFVASSSNTGAYRIQWSEDSGLNKGDIVLISFTSDSVKSGVVPTKPEGATKLLLYLYGNVEGTVAIGDTVTYSKIMLSNQPITDYEEYGAMPSPDFPSEIKNVGDDVNLAYISSKKDYNYSSTLEKDAVLINGTSTNAGNIELYLNGDDGITLKANKKYIVSLFFDGHVTGNGYKQIYLQGMPIGNIASNKMVTKEIILSEDKVCKTINLDLSANCTFDNMKVKVMITENGKLKKYIPYNCIKVTICNKNIINILDATEKTINGVTYSIKNGEITLNGTTNQDLEIVLARNISLKKETYTHSCSDILAGVFISLDNIGETMLSGPNRKTMMFNLQNDKVFSKYFMYINNGTTFNNTKIKLQIEKGRTATGIVTHLEQEIIFPLAEGQKLYEGSYLAEDGIHNIRIQDILTGEESLQKYHSDTSNGFVGFKFIMSRKHKKNADFLCTHLTKNSDNVYYNRGLGGWLPDKDRWCYICVPISILKDVSTAEKQIESMKEYLTEQYNAGTPMKFEYELAIEEIIPYTQEQKNAFYQLQNIILYDGINHISTDNELGSMSVEVSKIIEDYETYISSNGFFINSQNDIHYLIDFSESELPCMAEATETTVKAAGRNGDIVLSTTYDPNNFNIVCYTEDNLTQEEKVKEEMKLKKLLNSIKNKTIPLAFEKDDKFYKVKYSGAFSSTNFPKHLKFSIPLKTSEAYGKDLIKKVIFGNGEETSDTFEDVGAIFTIKGPANSPIISLNDYSIEYDNPLLEGDKLIINSSNSTITHINSDGVKTNAMRYYNHQFPKIENGKNVLKVLSGVNEANVSVEWYDYKF